MTRTWTPAQDAAIVTHGRTLLISAAAGSGKTATLTERIIRRLTDRKNPVELSRLLVVTYTRAAATELRERIGKALAEAIAKDPTNGHLRRQLLSLGSANISTIDSFMLEPVRAHFAELGLPAKTRIADDAELLPLSERVMGDLVEEFYTKYATQGSGALFSVLSNNPFADLCDSLTSSKNDEDLLPTLRNFYNRLLSFPDGVGRLKMEAEDLERGAIGEFFDTAHGTLLREWFETFLTSAEYTLSEVSKNNENGRKDLLEAIAYDTAFVKGLKNAKTYAQVYALFKSYAPPKRKSHADIRTALLDFAETYFVDSPEELSAQMRKTALMCHVLYDFLQTYDERIQAEKQARGICDFDDNRRYMLRLLRDENGEPTRMAAELATRYDEVYIDEYQDVNEIQDEIFRLVGGNHRFMVGDLKQSIYSFQGSDPSVFARYRQSLPMLKSGNTSASGNSIFMSDNFRCDESVIRVTNAVCGHILRACPESVGYVKEDDLVLAKKPPRDGYNSTPVEIAVLITPKLPKGEKIDSPLSSEEAEAAYIANRIASLLRSKEPLASGEPIRPKDIAILLRKKSILPKYRAALVKMGIPVGVEELDSVEASKDLLHGGDMMYLLNLLRVIDDPDGDIALSEILRAPFPGFTLEEVLALRRADQAETATYSLYECLETYANTANADPALCERVATFLHWVEHYRNLCATQSAHGILRLLAQDEHCACRNTDAFRYLYDSARTCRVGTFVSLYTFLRFFEKKILTEKNVMAPVANEGEDGHVSIMTIHKSKGLEFPVCFVGRAGQAFSRKSAEQDLIFEKRTGLSMKLYQRFEETEDAVQSQAKHDTTLRAIGALATRNMEHEEEMRLLYVAMTRARERLFIVGLGNAAMRDGEDMSIVEGDRFTSLSRSNYLQWILAGLEAHPEVSRFYNMQYVALPDITPDEPLTEYTAPKEVAEDDTVKHYRTIPEKHRPPTSVDILLGRVPTKIPASRMQEKLLDTCVFYDTDLPADNDGKLPTTEAESWCDAMSAEAIRKSLELMQSQSNEDINEFEMLLGENRRPTAAERGTAAHLFLQYADYDRVRETSVEEEIARLREAEFINARTAEVLDRKALSGFFESDFVARLSKDVYVERELKFNRFVPLASLTDNAVLSEALGDRTLYVQGSIDLLAIFPDGHIELCDYKTDRITADERADRALLAAHMKEKHGDQLRQYAAAVEDLYGKRPSAIYIFSLPLGEAIEVDIS